MKFKAIIIEILSARKFIVKLEDAKIVTALLSVRIQDGNPKLSKGEEVTVLCNPYDKERVIIHKDTWGKR